MYSISQAYLLQLHPWGFHFLNTNNAACLGGCKAGGYELCLHGATFYLRAARSSRNVNHNTWAAPGALLDLLWVEFWKVRRSSRISLSEADAISTQTEVEASKIYILKCFNVKTLSLLPLFGDTLDNPLIIQEYIKIGGKKFSNASVTYLLPRHWPVSPDHFQIKCERLKGRKVESTQKKSVN